MRAANYFVLPPNEEYYYRRHHSEYRAIPAFAPECEGARTTTTPMDFLYPNFATRLFIPIDLGTQKGRVVFEAVHRDPSATMHWHLDANYLGVTRTFHQQALDIDPGVHVITIVDDKGQRLSRRFEVLARQSH